MSWLPYPADPQGPYRDRLLARFLLGRWSIRMHTGGGRDACPREKLAPELPG